MRKLLSLLLLLGFIGAARAQTNTITHEHALRAQELYDLNFSDAKIDLLLPSLKGQLADYQALHKFPLSNSSGIL